MKKNQVYILFGILIVAILLMHVMSENFWDDNTSNDCPQQIQQLQQQTQYLQQQVQTLSQTLSPFINSPSQNICVINILQQLQQLQNQLETQLPQTNAYLIGLKQMQQPQPQPQPQSQPQETIQSSYPTLSTKSSSRKTK